MQSLVHPHAAVRCARSRQSAPPDGVLSDAGSIPAASTNLLLCSWPVGRRGGARCHGIAMPMAVLRHCQVQYPAAQMSCLPNGKISA